MASGIDNSYMTRALALARQAQDVGEVPVGALLVADGEVIGQAFNQSVSTHDPTAHAEILALRAAGAQTENYRLPHTTLYVTIEPCLMCVGAMLHARIQRLVYGAFEPKAGAVSSHPILDGAWQNHRIEVSGGVRADEAANLMRAFFAQRRSATKPSEQDRQ